VLGLTNGVVNGKTIVVRADGTGDYPTIQTAIDASIDGDIVLVADGIYTAANVKFFERHRHFCAVMRHLTAAFKEVKSAKILQNLKKSVTNGDLCALINRAIVPGQGLPLNSAKTAFILRSYP